MKANFSKNFIWESIWKIISTTISKIGALIFVIILARFLNPEGFGIYNLAMSVSLVFIALTDVGINQTLIRYVSYSINKLNKKEATAYTKYLFKIKGTLILIFSIFLLLISYPLSIYIFKKPDLFFPLLLISIYLIFFALESFFESLIYALKKTKYLVLKEILFSILKISFALIIFSIFPAEHFVIGVIIALTISTLIILIFLFLFLKKGERFLFEKTDKKIDKKNLKKFLKYLTIGGLSGIFFVYIDTLILGIFISSAYVGYYAAAFTLISSIANLISVSVVALPTFTQLKKEQLKGAFDKIFKYTCILNIPLVFGTLAIGKYIIKLVYETPYLSATYPLYFLSPLIFSISLSTILVSLFSARERPKDFVRISVVSAILNIILNFIFITYFMKISFTWAMIGAAVATIISRFFYLFSLGSISKKTFGIEFKTKYWAKPLISSIIMFGVLFLFNSTVEDMTIVLGILEIIGGGLIYFVCMLLLKGIEKEDLFMWRDLIKR